ncbi:MAG TPA: ubiquitin-like small modifier protein 1 [Thermoanaerobaculia bacterium]|nr:ubiquitin-like small modifier protein 1 [Thermoanaerobaculia bacterium]
MSVTIHIPTPLRSYAGGQAEVAVDAATVGDALRALAGQYPSLTRHLYTDAGVLRSFVNVFVNDTNARELAGEATAVAPGDSLMIIPAIAGGRP